MTNIILCGGSKTRLWLIIRILISKQFVKLFNDNSLFQLIVERNNKICKRQLVSLFYQEKLLELIKEDI